MVGETYALTDCEEQQKAQSEERRLHCLVQHEPPTNKRFMTHQHQYRQITQTGDNKKYVDVPC